jgi:signal transduction histidine kinase
MRFQRSKGTSLLLVFLLGTLGLSLWLGYQALDAARSHRRTAEGVMADYAGIAAWEYSRHAQESLDYFYRSVFDDIPWTRRRRPPSPEVMANDLSRFLRSERCDCPGLRDRAWFFRLSLPDGRAIAHPDTLPDSILDRLREALRTQYLVNPDGRTGLFTVDKGALLERTGIVIYLVSVNSEESAPFAYGVVADSDAFGELFLEWYRDAALLPDPVTGSEPKDSLLQVSVRDPEGLPLFQSPVPYLATFSAADTLEPEYGTLVVEAAIRPDAASQLIIGGLPRSRLPLLLGLMLLTLGLGAAALLQLRRESQLARLQDDFISGVSHEFRTPLTQIRVFAELLHDEKLRTEEERARSTRVIDREARRLTHLVENILQFSRLSRLPTSTGDLEEIDLEAAAEELSEAFGPQADTRQARIEMAVPAGLVVSAGRGGLYRILANLLDNALKYGPAGQTVTLSARMADDGVRISVEDQGPGVPPRDRDRVWDPYRRLDRDVSGEVQGSGIGLAVVSQLCSAYGGRAWVEAGENGGAQFTVELPGRWAAEMTERGPDME